MLLININKITLEDAIKATKEGLYFKIQDGKIKGFTKQK